MPKKGTRDKNSKRKNDSMTSLFFIESNIDFNKLSYIIFKLTIKTKHWGIFLIRNQIRQNK